MDEGRDRADPKPWADGLPWPLSALDTSPAATRRRGLRFFHVVLLVLAGGSGLVVVGAWVLVPILIGVAAYLATIRRGGYPDLVAGVERMGTQLTELYASIEEANRRSEDAGSDPPDGRPDAVEPVPNAKPARDPDVGTRSRDI